MTKVRLNDLIHALMFVSFSESPENRHDVGEYLPIPDKRDLDLGNRLVFAFTQQYPADLTMRGFRLPDPPMTRKRKPAPRKSRNAASQTTSPKKRIAIWLRNLILGLALVSAISYLPRSLVEVLPEDLQGVAGTTLELTAEIREMAVSIVAGTGDAGGELLALLAPLLPEELREWLLLPDDTYTPVAPGELPRTAGSFDLAKRTLYERIYHDQLVTFYCGCRYNDQRQTDLASCGLDSLASINRAQRIEAEHVFPASQFGNFRVCWREPERFSECRKSNGSTRSGRECCERVDPTFLAAHNDLHNLFPAVGHINGQRSNYNWGMVSRGETYGRCEIIIDSETRRAQPPAAVRGDIARTMMYMADT